MIATLSSKKIPFNNLNFLSHIMDNYITLFYRKYYTTIEELVRFSAFDHIPPLDYYESNYLSNLSVYILTKYDLNLSVDNTLLTECSKLPDSYLLMSGDIPNDLIYDYNIFRINKVLRYDKYHNIPLEDKIYIDNIINTTLI